MSNEFSKICTIPEPATRSFWSKPTRTQPQVKKPYSPWPAHAYLVDSQWGLFSLQHIFHLDTVLHTFCGFVGFEKWNQHDQTGVDRSASWSGSKGSRVRPTGSQGVKGKAYRVQGGQVVGSSTFCWTFVHDQVHLGYCLGVLGHGLGVLERSRPSKHPQPAVVLILK